MSTALLLLIPPAVLAFFLARLFFGQGARVFRPSRQVGPTPADSGIAYEQVRLVCADGSNAPAWWVPAPRSGWTVVYFHGSDGNLTHEVPVARFLHALGVNALLVEYPGYGAGGARPSEHGCYRVAEAGWDFVVREKASDPHRTVLFGHSLGGAVATYLASRSPCGGLVIHSGFTSVPDLAARMYPYLPVRWFCRIRMDSLERIDRCRAPVLMVHSADDEHIPIDNAQRLYRRAPGPKRFVVLRGPHRGNSWQHQPPVLQAWRQLLDRRTTSWETSDGGDQRATGCSADRR
jgi:uncharacterized protein